MNVRDLGTSEIYEGKVEDLELVLIGASKNAGKEGFSVRIIDSNDNVVDSVDLKRSEKNGRWMARKDGKPYRWFKFIGWLFSIKKTIKEADGEITIQIGRLTATFSDTEIALILKRKNPKSGAFINQKKINL